MSRAVLLLALLASCGGPRRGQETGGEPDRLDERTTFDRRVEAELQDPPPRRRSRTSLRDAEFQLFLGIREFEDPAWEPLERQAGGGFALIQPIEGWRADLEGNLLFAVDRPQNDRPEDLRAVTVEGSAGLRLTGGGGRDLLRPFVGADPVLFVRIFAGIGNDDPGLSPWSCHRSKSSAHCAALLSMYSTLTTQR